MRAKLRCPARGGSRSTAVFVVVVATPLPRGAVGLLCLDHDAVLAVGGGGGGGRLARRRSRQTVQGSWPSRQQRAPTGLNLTC